MGLDDPSSPKTLNAAAAPETVAPEPPKPAFPPAPAAPAVPPQIEDFDTLINKDVRNFVDLGNKIGDLVAEQVRLSNRTSLHCGCDSLLTGFVVESCLTSFRSRAHLPLRLDEGEEARAPARRAHDRASHCLRFY